MFATRTLYFASLVAVFSQTAYAAKCVREYTVKAGDICDTISAANNASTYQLGAINPGRINAACTNLIPGSSICLGTEGEDCAETLVVTPNLTCEQIYAASQINSTIFAFNNPQVDAECSNIYIGEVLCVAKEVIVPPVPEGEIHVGPVPTQTVTFANGATSTPTESVTLTPEAGAPTQAPAVAAPANLAPAKPVEEEDEEEECEAEDDDEEGECEDIEVVEGPGNEDLPFCDELE
jgi:hypothetical protein